MTALERALSDYLTLRWRLGYKLARPGQLLGRLLELDSYDERAHLGLVGALVAARRHGEARRHHGRYVAAMAELGLPAAPFPSAQTVPE